MTARVPDDAFLVRPLRPDEAEAALRRSVEAFGGPAPHGTRERWERRAGDGELWAVEVDGDVMYRGLGWELAGDFTRTRFDTRQVPPVGPPLVLASAPDWDAVRACHTRFARTVNGAGVRSEDRWRELRETAEFAYVLEGAGFLEAYALVRHKPDPDGWRYVLSIEDWAAVTPRGLEAIAGFVGRHGTLSATAVLPGPAVRLLGMHVPEQADWDMDTDFSWMARGLDLGAAVGARGYPPGLAAEVTVSVDDPLLPEARGPWRLTVEEGKARLEPAAAADVTLRARAVGPLLTGFRDAATLALVGLAHGERDALATLSGIFAAPSPFFLDFF